MLLRDFISRPILASVIAIIIILCGLAAAFNMPLAQYPDISPPTIYVWTSYPGASAETIEKTVAAQLEGQLNGVPNVLYMQSTSTGSGSVEIVLTFEVGTQLNQAINDVLNRVHAATPLLPAIVQKLGVNVAKSSPNFLMGLYFYNDGSGKFDSSYMGSYLKHTLVNDLALIDGVGKVNLYANIYAMRVWMNLNAMNLLNITPDDIANAIKEQSREYTVGRNNSISSNPALLSFNITGSSMYLTPAQFANIIIRSKNNQIIRVRDVARVELGIQEYEVKPIVSEIEHKQILHNQIAFLQIMMAPGANQLKVRSKVMEKLTLAAKNFPHGLVYKMGFDGSKFVNESLKNVWYSLLDAFVLVAVVIFLFLQNFRASLIALITVPVSLIGSCAIIYLFGFSLNTLTLFAAVLAIGIVVDDAIIVIENIERLKHKQANFDIKSLVAFAMQEIFGAIIAIALVLVVVFIPVMVLPGMSGVLYRQFAVTIACAVSISAVVALTTTPALSALLLNKTVSPTKFALKFDALFKRLNDFYVNLAAKLIARGRWVLVILLVVIALVITIFHFIPTSLVPNEDQGFIVGSIVLPTNASLEMSEQKTNEIANFILKIPGVDKVTQIIGIDFFGGGVNSYATTLFVTLKDWQYRNLKVADVDSVALMINILNARFKDVKIMAFNLPAIYGLGTTGGVEFYLEGRTISDLKQLDSKAKQLEGQLMRHKEIQAAYHLLDTGSEQIMLDVDSAKTKLYGVNVNSVYDIIHYIYSNYNVNFSYKMQSLIWVILQGEYRDRVDLRRLSDIFVKNKSGSLVNVNSLIRQKRYQAPLMVERFNGYTATKLIVTPNKGYSSGEVMDVIRQEMSNTARGFDYEWVGTSFMQKKSQQDSLLAFVFAFVCIYLVLSALYGIWRLPLVVLMVMPFALFGSGVMLLLRGQPNDLYFQISLVALLGLSAKNIILLIEFGLMNMRNGMTAQQAILHALALRFRPILMTSITFIVGALPLVFASGAGAGAQHSVGTGIIGGMLGSVILGTVVTPSFFVLLMKNYKHQQN